MPYAPCALLRVPRNPQSATRIALLIKSPQLLQVLVDLKGKSELENISQQRLARIRHFNPGFFNADCNRLTDLDTAFATNAFVGMLDNRFAIAHFKYPGGAGFQAFFTAAAGISVN
jgi:hypothetical protein